ncbi:MAG: hypothetical protein A2X20_08730 [Bacteroidetes bacterium GWE2_40_15]|nr:MAG: hypothetical protein A2X20_08730 [Bacteroidetes bacterium GWE2_40_15]
MKFFQKIFKIPHPKPTYSAKRARSRQPLSFRVNIKCKRGEYQQRKTLAPEKGGDPTQLGRIFRDDNSPKTSSITPKNLHPIKRARSRQPLSFRVNIKCKRGEYQQRKTLAPEKGGDPPKVGRIFRAYQTPVPIM